MSVPHEPLATVVGQLVGMAAEQRRDLGLDSLHEQRSRTVAQNLGQWVGKSSWLGELEHVSVAHGVSLLRWRSGGSNTPTIRRLNPSCRHQLSPTAPASASQDTDQLEQRGTLVLHRARSRQCQLAEKRRSKLPLTNETVAERLPALHIKKHVRTQSNFGMGAR